jgi:hypothetical protein
MTDSNRYDVMVSCIVPGSRIICGIPTDENGTRAPQIQKIKESQQCYNL